MKKILVTGSTGFIGNALVGGLKSNDSTVIGIERDENRKIKLRHTPDIIIKGDIRDVNLVRRVVADYEIEEIYHCAAQAIVRSCANDPYTTYDINIMGTLSLLEACRVAGPTVKSIVISTSDKAFGHAPIPYTESTPLNPLFTYETSKACQQMISLSYFHNYGIPVRVVACSNVYGPGDPNRSRIIPNNITRLLNDEPAQLNDGAASMIREYVYIEDVVNAFITVARNGQSGEVYCCGGTGHMSVIEMMHKLCFLMGKNPEKYIKIFPKPENFKEIDKQYIDSSKLQSIGWQPKTDLDKGLNESIIYYKLNLDS